MSDLSLKDPTAVLDYTWDWTAWLATGETIAIAIATATGVTVDATTNTTTSVTVRISGGTIGTPGTCTVRITTSSGQIDERTRRFTITDR